MITDQTIKSAIRGAPTSGKKSIELKDDGARGQGRLMLLIRVVGGDAGDTRQDCRVATEWYAIWYRGGKPAKAKMGVYPAMSLADARKAFTADYAPAIAKGERPEAPHARKSRLGITVKDLFQTYVDHLRLSGKASVDAVERMLLTGGQKGAKPAAKVIGETKRAADVTTGDITSYLRTIFERGSPVMADVARTYISAAYGHAMASQHSYTRAAGTVDWGIKFNPVSAIRSEKDARRAGNRYLNRAELYDFWHWLVSKDTRSDVAPALRLMICTGQRVTEILRVSDKVWSPEEKTFDWGKTKNGKPHNVPVPPQGVDIMAGLIPNKHGLYFPNREDPTKPTVWAIRHLIDQYLVDFPDVPAFTARDIRRTWKTLAGAAGVSKELRDRIQNHARSDISSKHYDRWEMLPERRAAMEVWSQYLNRIIAGEFKDNVVELPVAAAG